MLRLFVYAIVSLVVFVHTANSQSVSAPPKDNLYAVALEKSVLQMDGEWGHLGHTAIDDKLQVPIDYRHMLVQKDPIITDDLPTEFENHSIEFVDDQELVNRYRKLNKPFAVLRISPIRNQGNVLNVVVTTYFFSYKAHRVQFGLSDWSTVEFRYDCKESAFVVGSVKLGGI